MREEQFLAFLRHSLNKFGLDERMGPGRICPQHHDQIGRCEILERGG